MNGTSHPVPAPVSRWWILALVHLSVMGFALNLQMVPPLVPRLVSEMGLTHTGVGVLMGLFTLPGIFLAIPGGRVADALGPRGVAMWSLALLSVGAFLMLPPHPGFLYAGRLCAGIGGAVLVVVAPQIIARTFAGPELGIAMGVFNTAVPLGTILAFNLLGLLAGRFGIPVVLMAAASWAFLCLVAFYFTYADPRGQGPAAVETGVTRQGLGRTIWLVSIVWAFFNIAILAYFTYADSRGGKGPAEVESADPTQGLGVTIWVVSILWALFNIAILAYFTYSIDYFTGVGLAEPAARFTGSLPMMLSIVLTPVAGWAMHRYGLRWSLTAAGCALSAGAILLVMTPDRAAILLWSVVIGVGISMVPPAVFTIAGEGVPPSRMGTGYGLLTTIFNLGVFVGIPLVGHVRDITDSYRSSFILMAVIMGLGAVVGILFTRLVSKR